MRVLLVEDDEMIGAAVQTALRDHAYAVDWVKNGNDAIHSLMTHEYDLLLLDLGLPKKNGYEVLSTIRDAKNTLPILVISARDSTEDRILGLDSGADDYLVKPFEMGELFARIRAVTRRKSGNASPILSNGTVFLDPSSHQVSMDDEPSIQLTNREFSLLHALMIRPGAILSRHELEERVYSWGDQIESNAIEFLIHSLRKKLGRNIIKNIRA